MSSKFANQDPSTSPNTQHPTSLPLASRMKQYEESYDFTLTPSSTIILRLDGHNFSRFTSNFARPFDQRIHDAMITTCSDLLKFFPQASVAYTQSDEITLVFPAGVGAFNERVQKLASLAASYCSVRFGCHLTKFLEENPEPKVKDRAPDAISFAHFDARFFAVPSLAEALNCLLWRCRGDAVRNAASGFARTMFSHKEILGKSTEEVKEMMGQKLGVSWEERVPRWAIEGCLVKREKFEHSGINQKTGQTEVTWRTRTRVEERGVREWSEEGLRLVEEKFW